MNWETFSIQQIIKLPLPAFVRPRERTNKKNERAQIVQFFVVTMKKDSNGQTLDCSLACALVHQLCQMLRIIFVAVDVECSTKKLDDFRNFYNLLVTN